MGPPKNPTSQIEKQEAHGRNGRFAGGGLGSACSKDASGAFTPTGTPAVLQRGVPGGGAGVVGVEGPAALPVHGGGKAKTKGAKPALPGARQRPKTTGESNRSGSQRGSSLRNFFDGCCDRPGCYECFRRSRRSPLQRFCSQACQRAMERVWERERHWRRRRAPRHHLQGRRPRVRQP
jgi:hypothetical protein